VTGPRVRRRAPALLLALGAYGTSLAVVGVFGLIGPAPLEEAFAPTRTATSTGAAPAAPVETAKVVPPSVEVAAPAPVDPADLARAPVADAAGSQTTTFRPERLVLPSGTTAVVDPVGVHSDGALVVPDDPSRLGWWTGGAQAGDPFGSLVLAGHVDSREFGVGVLAQMRRIKVGQTLEVQAGAHVATYRVASITEVPKARLAEGTDAFRQDVPHRLVVITCGGDFDRVQHRYADNLVMVAVPVT
jgi:hypothetical protein